MKTSLLACGCTLAAATVSAALIDIGLRYEVPDLPEPADYASIVYVDPSAPTDGDGSAAAPRNHFLDLPLQAETAYLIRAGSVFEETLGTLPKHLYLGRYGEGPNPLFRGSGTCSPGEGDTFVGIDIERYGAGSWDKFLSISDPDVTFAECRLTGLPNPETGLYPYFIIRGSGGDRMTFYNCEISYTRVDGFLLRAGLENVVFVGNYFHHCNMGGGPGDGIQMGDGYQRAYFANNYMDRSDTRGKFCLIITATFGSTSWVEAEWNTFIAPGPGAGGAALHWYPGDHARLHHNLIESREGVSGISTGAAEANDPAPYGIRDNHLYGPGTHFYSATSYPASNLEFADLGAYETYLDTTPGAVRYGSNRFSPDRDEAPSVPTGITGSGVLNSILLSWAPSSDLHGVAGYRILRDGRTVGYAVGTEAYRDTGLAVSATHTYEVVAYDYSGTESGRSEAVTATTADTMDGEPPTAPTNLRGTPTINEIEVSWDPSVDNLGIVDYRLYRDHTLLAEQATTTFADSGLMPDTTYLYTVEAVDRTGNRASSSIALTTPGTGLPAGWNYQSLGGISPAATPVAVDGETITLTTAGTDLWNGSDSGGFAYRPLDGDGEIIVRVLSLEDTDDWAKAGVMIRASLAWSAANVALLVTPNLNVPLQFRPSEGASTDSVAASYPALPWWLRLVRSGDTFTGAMSTDGQTWTTVGSTTVAMSQIVSIGLVHTSHNNGTAGTAVFDQLTITSGNEGDLDFDGLDDAWEILHFGNLKAAPGEDADRDGTTNHFEWLAQTDPMDPSSVFRHSLTESGGAVEVRIAPVRAGLGYILRISHDLDSWTEEARFDATADAAEHLFSGLSAGDLRFYQIQIEAPSVGAAGVGEATPAR